MNNDTITLFLATSILAIGGLGLYMFNADNKPNSRRKNKKEIIDHYNDDDNSDETQLEEPDIESEQEQEQQQEQSYADEEPDEYVSTKSKGSKTKKSRKQTRGTKRRY